MSDLQGKTFVVTGATGALGTALTSHLLHRGAACHVTWIVEQELENYQLEEGATLHRLDCQDEQAVGAFYQSLSGLWGSIHLVGGFAMVPITDTSADQFRAMWNLNALSCFLCCREAVRAMRRHGQGGRIVNVSARPALEPYGGAIAYAASKAAVASITRCLADEVKAEGILVNAVAPSIMDTPANRAGMPDADFSTWPKVSEVASAIGFLGSAQNAITSGIVLPVFGRA